MLSFDFKVDEDMIAKQLVRSAKSLQSNGRLKVETLDYLYALDKSNYIALSKLGFSTFASQEYIDEIKKIDNFPDFVDEARQNKSRIEKIANQKLAITNEFLKKITRVDLQLENVQTFIMPQDFNSGCSNKRRIAWGNVLGTLDDSFDMIYLVHEALHGVFGLTNIEHSIIEEIADYEFNKFLNNQYKPYYPTWGHVELNEFHVKIFPFWNLYLHRTPDEIDKECASRKIFYNKQKYEYLRPLLCKMNIFEFKDWLLQQNLKEIKLETIYKILN